MLYNIIIAVITLICVLLTLVILLQNGQGQGLSGIASAGAGMGGSAGLGARRTADLLSKATTVLGAAFLALCVLANFAIDRNTAPQNSVLEQGAPINDIAVPSQTQSAVPSQTPPPPVNNDGGSDDSDN
ncbi:MAG: preprotein translocase subunit SecG [Balneola sp.]|nr:MAG: preprotein translocase subunit SecG [Balneola sp.]